MAISIPKLAGLISCIALCSCSQTVERLDDRLAIRNQQDPALSGSGEKLALIVEFQGRPSVQLRDLKNGKILPLRHFSRNQPHSSPSLSWNGRYLAAIGQRVGRRLIIIEDRLTGRSHQFPISVQKVPVRISLSPDASQLAIQVAEKGKWRIELFDLSKELEIDKPRGIVLSNNF